MTKEVLALSVRGQEEMPAGRRILPSGSLLAEVLTAMHDAASTPCLRVLVVDDSADVRNSLATLLTLWGHTYRLAVDGPDALRLAPEFRPHVVLLDIGMPGMNGWEVARRLRTIPELIGAFLIVISAYDQDVDKEVSWRQGCHLHLVKPVDPSVLEMLLQRKKHELRPTRLEGVLAADGVESASQAAFGTAQSAPAAP